MVTKVKICGITNLEDALVAVEAGADLLGFIFYEPSPRYVRPEVVREIVAGVGGWGPVVGGPIFVGVFVNSPLDIVTHILDFCHLDAAQLHGEEPSELVGYFAGRAFKALRPQSQEEAEALIQKYQPSPGKVEGGRRKDEILEQQIPTFLLDAYHPSLYGGTGHVTDWTLAARIARRYPIMLAGSLTPENVAEAVRVVRPWGVDVSSGVEKEKGKKDHEKVRALVEAVKSVKRNDS